jgi:LuxR family maltose regulon positive regulatory protein
MQKDAELGVATTAPKSQWGASARMLLGVAALLRGDAAEADAAFADAVEVGTEVGANVGVSIAFAERALLASDRGDRVQADVFARTACEVVHESGLDDYGTSAVVYAASARTAIERGDRERAADEVARIERLSPRLTYAIPWLAAQARIELALAHLSLGNTVRAVQVAAEIDGILEHRPDLGFDDRLAELRSRLAAGTALDEGWGATLTNAELRLLPLLTTHLSYREIAERLGISRNTVKTQAISVYRRLEVSSRSEAIARAGELGLL